MDDRRPDPPRDYRETVEEYTPDGAAGRLLLALASGTLSFVSFWLFAIALTEPGLLMLGLALVGGAVWLGAAALTLLVLWPVYLSLIGRLETAADYDRGDADDRTDEDADPVTLLKREYARGNVTEAEFERRMETLLGTDEGASAGGPEGRPSGRSVDEELEDLDRA